MTTNLTGASVYWNDAPQHCPAYEVRGIVTEHGERDMLTIAVDEGPERYRYVHQIIVQSLAPKAV